MDPENPDTIVADVSAQADEHEFDATDAFLKDAETPRKDDPADPSDAEGDATETAGTEEPKEPDEPEFDVKVGEETRKAKLSELTRLYGQEAALTQKSQALAEARTKAESQADAATAILTEQKTRAQKLWEPYANLDFLALSTQMTSEDFVALRAEASAALNNLNTLTSTLDGHEKVTQDRRAVLHRERAQVAITELSDPDKGIKGWGPELYNDLMGYAETQGMSQAAARGLVDAAPLRLLHKAMLYDRGAAKTAEVKKVVAKATVTLKPGPTKAEGEGNGFKTALRAMRSSGGNLDATADAFLALGKQS